MVLGRPVIASSAGPSVEMIDDGLTGLLVPPGDARALSHRILELLDNPEMRDAMGRHACEKAMRLFDIGTNVKKTEDIFRDVLRNGAIKERLIKSP